jgi:hypothetical protein
MRSRDQSGSDSQLRPVGHRHGGQHAESPIATAYAKSAGLESDPAPIFTRALPNLHSDAPPQLCRKRDIDRE